MNPKTIEKADANGAAAAAALNWARTTYGTPLNDGPRPAPPERAWTARGRNTLFSGREPFIVRGPTFESARAEAIARGLDRPSCLYCCPRCGRLLVVVDPRNAESLLIAHQASEKCLYRSVVVGLLWQGWAPVTPIFAVLSEPQVEALAAWDGPGNKRDTRRPWAPVTRVLASMALRLAAHDAGTSVPADGWEIVQGLADDWEPSARAWVADLTADADDLHSATAVYDALIKRVVATQQRYTHGTP